MNNRNEDKLSMYEKVQLFLRDHINSISPIISNALNVKSDFDQKIQDLMITIASAGTQTTGYTQIKENARQQLEISLLRIIRGLKAVAIDNQLLDLKAKSDYSRSAIERLRDSEIYTTSIRIFDLANQNQVLLTNYSITPAHIQNLYDYKEAFFAVIQLPKDKIGERASYNQLIEIQIRSIDLLLKERLDTYMELIEFDLAQLFVQYKSSRAIDSSSGGSSSRLYSGTVSSNLTVVVVRQSYNADRSYTFMNKGDSELIFGLSLEGINITGTSLILQSGDEISRDASDLNEEGEFLLVINPSTLDGEYKVEADK